MGVQTITDTNIEKLVQVSNEQVVTDSRKVAEVFAKEHKHVLDSVRQILAAENSATRFFYKSTFENRGKQYPCYLMNRDGFSLLVMGFTGDKAMQWKIKYIEAFNAMEEQLKAQQKPMSQLDILVESAKALQAHERELARLRLDNEEIRQAQKEQADRLNDLNGVCTEGTLRQRLVAIVNAYARKNGLTYDKGWRDFKAAYNTAFHTNLSLSRKYFMEQNGLKKKPSVPEFLEIKNLLGDAVRVADKMLNGGCVA